MLYPNFPGRAAFSTNHVEPGVHLAASPAILAGQRSRHKTQLMTLDLCRRYATHCTADTIATSNESGEAPFSLPSVEELPLYDFYCAPQPAGVDGLDAMVLAGNGLEESAVRAAAQEQQLPSSADDPSNDGSRYVPREYSSEQGPHRHADGALQEEL